MSLPPIGSFNSFILSTSPSLSPSSKLIQKNQSFQFHFSKLSLPYLKISSHQKRLEDEALAKNQYILSLNNEHSILRSLITVDKEEAALRDDSSLHKSFKRISAALKLIGKGSEDRFQELSTFSENLLPVKEKKIRKKLQSVESALEEIRHEENERWVSKKKVNPSQKLSKDFVRFLRDLFEALDEDHSGNLTPDEIIFPILSYGITSDFSVVEKALMHILDTKTLGTVKIEKENFIKLFREDYRTDTILNALQVHTKSMTDREEEIKLARRKTLPHIVRAETKVEDIVPKVYCTIEDFMRRIKSWWDSLLVRSVKENKIHFSVFADFLVNQKLVSNNIEATRICNSIEQAGLITYENYEKVFLKALFKSALLNLAHGLSNVDLAGKDTSLMLKLGRCSRRFMVAGVSARNNEVSLQGKRALKAIQKYQDTHKNTARQRAAELAHIELQKINEETGGERLKNYLYRINEHAKEFVDDLGNIATKLKDPWDIRDKVNQQEAKVDNAIDPEETFNKELYLSMLSPISLKTTKVVTLPNNVRMFRENYLLEKFKKSSVKNEKYRHYHNQSI